MDELPAHGDDNDGYAGVIDIRKTITTAMPFVCRLYNGHEFVTEHELLKGLKLTACRPVHHKLVSRCHDVYGKTDWNEVFRTIADICNERYDGAPMLLDRTIDPAILIYGAEKAIASELLGHMHTRTIDHTVPIQDVDDRADADEIRRLFVEGEGSVIRAIVDPAASRRMYEPPVLRAEPEPIQTGIRVYYERGNMWCWTAENANNGEYLAGATGYESADLAAHAAKTIFEISHPVKVNIKERMLNRTNDRGR